MLKNDKKKRPPPKILYSDESLIIVDKDPGILTHPNQYDRKTPSLVNTLSGRMHARVYPVHRLDRDTSGVILFTLDKKAARTLGEAITDKFSKEYMALCAGHMGDDAEVTVPVRQGGNGEKQPARSIISGRGNCVLDGMELCLLSVTLITGRTHQARIHCETIAKPIIGDRQHGWKPMNSRFAELPAVRTLAETLPEEASLPPMFLRSWKLEFPHPVSGKTVSVCAGLPESWRALIARFDAAGSGDSAIDPILTAAASIAVDGEEFPLSLPD